MHPKNLCPPPQTRTHNFYNIQFQLLSTGVDIFKQEVSKKQRKFPEEGIKIWLQRLDIQFSGTRE